MFDDRLEIQSPGKLGGFITLDNMINNRYSRNPQIARTLLEFGLVRELNEGIKRIYSSMEEYFLNRPIYSEPNHSSVLLVLENNIVVRANRKQEYLKNTANIRSKWNDLSYAEQKVLQVINDKGEITADEVSNIIDRGRTTSVKLLNGLIEKGLIVWNGTSKSDSYGRYIMK